MTLYVSQYFHVQDFMLTGTVLWYRAGWKHALKIPLDMSDSKFTPPRYIFV